jgi:hypothetical protein
VISLDAKKSGLTACIGSRILSLRVFYEKRLLYLSSTCSMRNKESAAASPFQSRGVGADIGLPDHKMSKTQQFYLIGNGNCMYFLLRVYYIPRRARNQRKFGKAEKKACESGSDAIVKFSPKNKTGHHEGARFAG